MAILQITTDFAGEVGVKPRLIRIWTNNTYEQISAAGFLSPISAPGYSFDRDDMTAITYFDEAGVPAVIWLKVVITNGVIRLRPIPMDVSFPVTDGNIAVFDGTSGTIGNGPVLGSRVLTSAITTPDVGPNLISFDVTVEAAALATGGAVTLINSSGTKQYRIRVLQLNPGTNFSGGGGNRLGHISDSVTTYSDIPAATMQTLVNANWGSVNLAFPNVATINTPTAAGLDLLFSYTGGTTDYSAGSLVISGIAERIA